MKRKTPVSAIMTKDVITLDRKDSLETAERIFKSKKIRHIPVVSGKHVVGILSYTDLLRISFADAIIDIDDPQDDFVYDMFTIDQIMAKNLISIPSTATIQEVAEILSKRAFHALPVVDGDVLKGIVTTTDLINYLLEQF